MEIDEIRERCEKAMPGPWIRDKRSIIKPIQGFGNLILGSQFDKNEGDFVAHAREDIPLLLREVDRLVAVNAEQAARIAELERERDAYKRVKGY